MGLRRLVAAGAIAPGVLAWIATARTRATFAFRPRRKALDAAIATRVVRYSARHLLSQRRLVESLARCNSRGGSRWCCAQGKALAHRSGASQQAIRTGASRGGAADQCRPRGRRADFVGELWGGGRGQARRRARGFARARA